MQKERDFLLRTGMINAKVFAGMQPDDCVRWKKTTRGYQNHSLCNHTCAIEVDGKPTEGKYLCEASFIFAIGSIPGFAPTDQIVRWTKIVAVAQRLANQMFFDRHFGAYCEEFAIPPSWADAIRFELTDPNKKVECNRFGGSPEMLPDCTKIIQECQDFGLVVNLTTPGRRFMQDKKFVTDIAANPPNILAMSFDDMDPKELARIAKMDLDAIKAEWRTVPPHWGQKQKAYEGIYTAKLLREMNVPITILFNVVIHPGNVGHVDDILSTIAGTVPGALANAYPAQAFPGKPGEIVFPCWTPSSLGPLRSHVNKFIEGTLEGRPGVTRRLHYYVALESAFRHWSGNKGRVCEFMSGIGAWDSTLRPGAYRYAQIGKSLEALDWPQAELPTPGGHLGCFWNPVLGVPWQVDEKTVEEVADFLSYGIVEHGEMLGAVRKSNIMPRLMFDVVATEQGLPYKLVPEYLKTRKEYCGY